MLKQAVTGMTKQERITTQAYNEMTKSVAGSNSIVLNDVQGDTTINNHHTHTHNHSDADGKALSMRLTPRPLLSDRQAAAFARTGKLTGSFDLFASVVAPSQYTFAVAMPDTSMSPVIEKGDLVVVEPRMRPADEDIALIELSDKRLVVAHLVIDIAGRSKNGLCPPHRREGVLIRITTPDVWTVGTISASKTSCTRPTAARKSAVCFLRFWQATRGIPKTRSWRNPNNA